MFQRFFIASFLSAISILSAQQPSSPPPLELPDIVISGKEKIDIPAGTKQMPEKPKPLSKKELDSLNALDKQPALLLSLGSLYDNLTKKQLAQGFVRGEIGLFISPILSAGYRTESGGYKFNTLGEFASSSGHLDNAEFTKLNVQISADYIAPEKFVFFGGSKTESEINVAHNSYKLYSLTLAPERTTTYVSVKMGVSGDYNGFGYSAGGRWSGFGLSSGERSISDNALTGNLSVQQTWKETIIGARILLDLHTFNGKAVNFLEAGGFGEYSINNWTLNGNLALQTANTSKDITLGGVYISGRANYHFSPLFTVRGEISSGLGNNSFREMILHNPYLTDSSEIDFERTHISTKASILYHPVEALGLTFGIEYKITSHSPLMIPTLYGTFLPIYTDISRLQIYSEFAWDIAPKDNVTSRISVTSASLSDNTAGSVPYLPTVILTGQWRRNWSEQFGTQFTVNYTGSRYVDTSKSREISGFVICSVRGEYTIIPSARVYFRVENILNSSVFMWDTYKERGIFTALGIEWQF